MLSVWFAWAFLCIDISPYFRYSTSIVCPLCFFFVCLVLAWHFFNLFRVVQGLLPLSLSVLSHMKCYCVKPDTLSVPSQDECIFKWHLPEFYVFIYNVEILDINGLSKYLPLYAIKTSSDFTWVFPCAKAGKTYSTLRFLTCEILQLSDIESSEAAVGISCCKHTAIPEWFITGVLALLVSVSSQ